MSSTLRPPPPGVESDWSDAGWAPAIEAICIVLLVLNTLFTASRLYTRVYLLRSFGIDDCFCIFAYGMATTQLAWHFVAVRHGFGRHIWNIPKTDAPGLYKSFFVIQLVPGLIYLFVKLTLLLTYSRLFKPVRYMRWLIWTGIVACVGFYTGTFFNSLFKCRPMAKAWDPSLKGTCRTEAIPGSPTGIFNVITDTYILLLPVPMVWSLSMSWKRKIKVLSVLSLGLFTVCTSIVRLAETIVQNGQTDFTYHYGEADIFANLEYSVGLMVACMLVFPAFWDRVLRRPFSSCWTQVSSAYRSLSSARSQSVVTRNESVTELTEFSSKATALTSDHAMV